MHTQNQQLVAKGSEIIGMFCRLNLNTKNNLPIRSSEMGLLIFISQSPDPVTPLDAANFFHVSKPMIAAMVTSLHKKAYLSKTPCELDGRSYYLSLEEKSIQLVQDAYKEYSKVMNTLIEKMGLEDYTQMLKLLETANTYIGDL